MTSSDDLKYVKLLLWLLSIAFLVYVVSWIEADRLIYALQKLGVVGVLVWVGLTLISRWLQSYLTVLPLRVLDAPLAVMPAFWLGWVRTFCNQLLPTFGLAAYVHLLQKKTGASWACLSALALPQFILAGMAIGLLGLLAVGSNLPVLGKAAPWLSMAYAALVIGAILLIVGTKFSHKLPLARFGSRVLEACDNLRLLAGHRRLLLIMEALHLICTVFRGLRLLLLFVLLGSELTWQEVLLITSVAESSQLLHVTPGGLVVREGAIAAGAALVGVALQTAVTVALIDRLLVMAISSILIIPAMGALNVFSRRSRSIEGYTVR